MDYCAGGSKIIITTIDLTEKIIMGDNKVRHYEPRDVMPRRFGGNKDTVWKDIDLENNPKYQKFLEEKKEVEEMVRYGNDIFNDILLCKTVRGKESRLNKRSLKYFKSEEELDAYIEKNKDLFNPRWLRNIPVRTRWKNYKKVECLETGKIYEKPGECWKEYPRAISVYRALSTGEPDEIYNLHFRYIN
jgi:hypothetical protein